MYLSSIPAFHMYKSRSARSSAIIGIWPHISGILTTNCTKEHVRVGIIEYFLLHSPSIEQNDKVQKVEYLLAYVKWYQDYQFGQQNSFICYSIGYSYMFYFHACITYSRCVIQSSGVSRGVLWVLEHPPK